MRNKKGFTLVELLVSFVLITVVSMTLFRTTLSLQKKQQVNLAKNKYKAFTVVLNNSIQKDFLTDRILSIKTCGINCYDIVYEKKGNINLALNRETNVISYGTTVQELPDDYLFYDDISVTYFNNIGAPGLNSYIVLSLPVKSSLQPDLEEIKYMYQYNDEEYKIDILV